MSNTPGKNSYYNPIAEEALNRIHTIHYPALDLMVERG
jgi:hypothetical protein